MGKPISTDKLKRLLDEGTVLLLDVRRKADFDAEPNLIPGASWRDPEQVEEWRQQLSGDTPVVIYCVKGGSVSRSITETLNQNHIKACYVEGGLKAWKESGGTVE